MPSRDVMDCCVSLRHGVCGERALRCYRVWHAGVIMMRSCQEFMSQAEPSIVGEFRPDPISFGNDGLAHVRDRLLDVHILLLVAATPAHAGDDLSQHHALPGGYDKRHKRLQSRDRLAVVHGFSIVLLPLHRSSSLLRLIVTMSILLPSILVTVKSYPESLKVSPSSGILWAMSRMCPDIVS